MRDALWMSWGRRYRATSVGKDTLWPRLSPSRGTAVLLMRSCVWEGVTESPCRQLEPHTSYPPHGYAVLTQPTGCERNMESVRPQLGLETTVERNTEAAPLPNCRGAERAWRQGLSQPMTELGDLPHTQLHIRVVKRRNISRLLGCFWSLGLQSW